MACSRENFTFNVLPTARTLTLLKFYHTDYLCASWDSDKKAAIISVSICTGYFSYGEYVCVSVFTVINEISFKCSLHEICASKC
jgi:hypothetical protein